MLKIILTRTHIGKDYMKGIITIGTSFACYSYERADPRGEISGPITIHYALPSGTYPVKLRMYKWYPFTPYIICKPYKRISFVQQELVSVRAGCIAIGTHFTYPRFLEGFDQCMDAFCHLARINHPDWNTGEIDICYNPDYVPKHENTFDPYNNEFNFIGL